MSHKRHHRLWLNCREAERLTLIDHGYAFARPGDILNHTDLLVARRDHGAIALLDAERIRAAAPDGMLGGSYVRPDEDMQVVWDAGVAEVRSLLESGWAQ